MNKKKYEFWMNYALNLAKKALYLGEVPVGAILVYKNKIIGEGWNSSINNNDPTAHAEILALRHASIKIKNYRLMNSTLYVTLEPCLMCLGALIESRVKHIVFGAQVSKNLNSAISIYEKINKFGNKKKIIITKGVLSYSCSLIIKNFFRNIRKKNNLLKKNNKKSKLMNIT